MKTNLYSRSLPTLNAPLGLAAFLFVLCIAAAPVACGGSTDSSLDADDRDRRADASDASKSLDAQDIDDAKDIDDAHEGGAPECTTQSVQACLSSGPYNSVGIIDGKCSAYVSCLAGKCENDLPCKASPEGNTYCGFVCTR